MNTFILHLQIIKEFFQIGLFSFGGGYSTLPFLYDLTKHYSWYTSEELSQIIAVASITPGPVGLNIATYAGMKVNGILTAFCATCAIVLPALIIGILVSKLLKKFKDNFYVKSALWALKPTSCALLSYVAIKLFIKNIMYTPNTIISGALFLILLITSLLKSKDTIWYIAISAFIGIIFVKLSII